MNRASKEQIQESIREHQEKERFRKWNKEKGNKPKLNLGVLLQVSVPKGK